MLSELKTRGLNDILIACIDGLKGFPDAIAAEYPDTQVQLCIVPMIRNSLKLVAWKDYRAVTQGLKEIDQSVCETEASAALDDFARIWDSKYPRNSKSWRHHWDNLIPLFAYPAQTRKAIYTTNAIESLNSVIRKATKKRKLFPTDDAALKVVYLVEDRRGGAAQYPPHPTAAFQRLCAPGIISYRCLASGLFLTPSECCPGTMINNGGRGRCVQNP